MCKRLTSDIKHFTIKQILIDHWSNFVKSNPELNIRPVVFKEQYFNQKPTACCHPFFFSLHKHAESAIYVSFTADFGNTRKKERAKTREAF